MPNHFTQKSTLATFLTLFTTVGTLYSSALLAQQSQLQARPFRMGVILMNPDLDRVKPLAQSDNGGFAMRGDVLIGGYNADTIRAYNIETRKNLWWQKTDGEVTAPPLIVENNLFVTTRSGHVMALNVSTGERLWDTTLDSYSERPLIWSNGFLYVVSTGQVVYSIEASSGKRVWVHDAGFPDMGVVRRPPAAVIHDGRVIVGLATGELLALKIEDGKRLWRYNPFYQEARFKDVIGEMIVHNGKLLISRYDGLVALVDMSQERQVIWQDRQTSVSTSAFRAGRYYAGLVNGDILAYDASTGRVNWRSQLGVAASFMVASETSLYVIGTNGRIMAVDIATGGYQWGDDLGGRVGTAPIVTGNKMYVATGLQNLYGYKIQ